MREHYEDQQKNFLTLNKFEVDIQTHIHDKYNSTVKELKTELRIVKNVLRIPRLSEMFRKKLIEEELKENIERYQREQFLDFNNADMSQDQIDNFMVN